MFEIVAMWHIISLSLGRRTYFMEDLNGNSIPIVPFIIFSW